MTSGSAVVFLRRDGAPLPPGCAGHVGWAFRQGDGTYMFGSTENTGGWPIVLPGGDNGAWHAEESLQDAIDAMSARNYDAYKVAVFRDPHADAALACVAVVEASGYTAAGNNCLDHCCAVLKAYGQPDLPWPSTHPSPNDWFAAYNGEFHNIGTR